MFTGIVERTGTVVSVAERGGVKRITVDAPEMAGRLREGDSLAVSGVCLTALEVNPLYFHADLAAETLERTSLGALKPGAKVNLELPTAAGSPLGGHIVQGHVDGAGTMVSLTPVAPLTPEMTAEEMEAARETTDWWLTVRVPEHVRVFLVEKGSVSIEGISLTIAKTTIPDGGDTISIAILPLTYWRTNLHTLNAGAPLNVEADVLMKLAMQRMESAKKAEFEITEEWLVTNGY